MNPYICGFRVTDSKDAFKLKVPEPRRMEPPTSTASSVEAAAVLMRERRRHSPLLLEVHLLHLLLFVVSISLPVPPPVLLPAPGLETAAAAEAASIRVRRASRCGRAETWVSERVRFEAKKLKLPEGQEALSVVTRFVGGAAGEGILQSVIFGHTGMGLHFNYE